MNLFTVLTLNVVFIMSHLFRHNLYLVAFSSFVYLTIYLSCSFLFFSNNFAPMESLNPAAVRVVGGLKLRRDSYG